MPVPTKKFSTIHSNPFVPGRGCVELGEVWGDLPFSTSNYFSTVRCVTEKHNEIRDDKGTEEIGALFSPGFHPTQT